MTTNIYTAVVTASSALSYTSGATFYGNLVEPSTAIVYTLGQAVSTRSSLTLTVTLTGRNDQLISASVVLTSANAGEATPQQLPAPLTTSSSISNARNTLATINTSSLLQTTSSSVATQSIVTTTTNASSISSATSSTAGSSAVSSTTDSSAAASTSTANASVVSASQGHSTGELIGVAIGVLLAGALVAALVTFVMMRKRNRKNSGGYGSVQRRPSPGSVAGEAMFIDGKSWKRHLPQSEAGHTISRATNEVFDQIELHVENFYANRMVEMQSTTADRPTQLLYDAVSSGLEPISAIKYVMTTTLLSSITFQEATDHSLLPTDYNTTRVQASYGKPGKSTEWGVTNLTSIGFDQALSQWRTLTAYLGSDAIQTEMYSKERERKIAAITNQLCRTFRPWLQGDNNSCYQSTNGVLRRGSDLGVMLFSQPASFAWDWGKDQQRREERRTVLPGLLKMTDENAQPLVKHVCLVKRRTET